MITIYIGKPEEMIESEPLDAAALGVFGVFEILQSFDLFGERKTYRIQNLDASEDLRQEFFKMLADNAVTANDAVVVLEKLLVADRKKVEPFAKIVETKTKAIPKESFNAFALGNAFATGDKKKTWMVFQELLTHDDEMEKTHGLLWWKLKDMMLKKSSFSKEQMQGMARNLVGVYHESRLGGLDMKERLELFILTMPEIKK